MQVCTSLQTDNHVSTSPLSFLQAGCPSCRPTNSVKSTEGKNDSHIAQWMLFESMSVYFSGRKTFVARHVSFPPSIKERWVSIIVIFINRNLMLSWLFSLILFCAEYLNSCRLALLQFMMSLALFLSIHPTFCFIHGAKDQFHPLTVTNSVFVQIVVNIVSCFLHSYVKFIACFLLRPSHLHFKCLCPLH